MLFSFMVIKNNAVAGINILSWKWTSLQKKRWKDIELVEEEEPQIGADRSSATSNKSEIYNEEARNATQKHKPKRVESVNADAEAFGDHWKILIALCILKLKH